jgi:hypothetical protein
MKKIEEQTRELEERRAQLEYYQGIVKEQNESGIQRFDKEGITPEFLMLLGASFAYQAAVNNVVFTMVESLTSDMEKMMKYLGLRK